MPSLNFNGYNTPIWSWMTAGGHARTGGLLELELELELVLVLVLELLLDWSCSWCWSWSSSSTWSSCSEYIAGSWWCFAGWS